MTKHTSLVEFTIWPFTEDFKDTFINTAVIDGYFIEFTAMGNFERDIESTTIEALFVENEISIQSWIDDYRSSPDPRVRLSDGSRFPINIYTIWEAEYWQDHNGEWDCAVIFKGIVDLTPMLRHKETVEALKSAANTIGAKNQKAMSIGLAALKNKEVTENQYIPYIADELSIYRREFNSYRNARVCT